MIAHLQATMASGVGPIRTGLKLSRALDDIAALAAELGERPAGRAGAFDLQRLEWFDLRNMITVAHAVAASALRRSESRGAHQREDFSETLPQSAGASDACACEGGELQISGAPAARAASAVLVS